MKRSWTTAEQLRQQRIRSRKRGIRNFPRSSTRRPSTPNSKTSIPTIQAPAILSLSDAPEATIRFCNHFRGAMRRYKRVRVDLTDVERFSSDAVTLARAVMTNGTADVGGNWPANPQVAAKLKESGFAQDLKLPPGQELPRARGVSVDNQGTQVLNIKADKLVDFARANSGCTDGEADASYQTLIELMANTLNHASGSTEFVRSSRSSAIVPWFAMVHCEDGMARFTFVDLGVGILRSAPARGFLQKLDKSIGTFGHTSLLEAAFKGEVGSSTDLPGRGFGLPKMHADAKGPLPTLRVLTGSAIGDIGRLDFRRVAEGFEGTIFTWTVGQQQTEL